MVGERKIFQGVEVEVVYQVSGDEFVIQMPNGDRQQVTKFQLSDIPKPASNRPIITKGAEDLGKAPEAPPADAPLAGPPEQPKTEVTPPAAPEAPAAPVTPATPEAPQF